MKNILQFENYHEPIIISDNKVDILKALLSSDLDYHNEKTAKNAHTLHAFPAKFPPQIPAKFIKYLTDPGQIVLDPMMGSGTTIVEAILNKRKAIGIDLDPLSYLIVNAKVNSYNKKELSSIGKEVATKAYYLFKENPQKVKKIFCERFKSKSKSFIEFWFSEQTILELTSLLHFIDNIEDEPSRNFLKVVFSSTIITKSGGVSLALDLAHTRPHKAKIAIDSNNKVLYETDLSGYSQKRQKILTKKLRSAFDIFNQSFKENIHALFENVPGSAKITQGDAQSLPIDEESVNLIITSPPYACNAIDYMRAHKFSLTWLGHDLSELSKLRNEYIGGESVAGYPLQEMPEFVKSKIQELQKVDAKKSKALHRYFSEMCKILSEMYRVLKHDSAAILVVGNSNLKGVNTELQKCLPALGQMFGFETPAIGIRNLDRNRRMMPVGIEVNNTSKIEKRMHIEYIISFYKH